MVASAKTGIAFFDYSNKKISSAPKSFIDYIGEIK